MSSSEARRGVPTSNGNTATAKDYAFSNASDVDANSRISQNAENVNNGITRLADLGYDVSNEVGSKTKKVVKKAADIANEHPLGGTTKLVDASEVEGSGPERRKVLNFSGLESQ